MTVGCDVARAVVGVNQSPIRSSAHLYSWVAQSHLRGTWTRAGHRGEEPPRINIHETAEKQETYAQVVSVLLPVWYQEHTHVRLHVRVYVCVCVCVRACMCVCFIQAERDKG